MSIKRYPYFVEERLVGGGPNQRSLCHICPLNGQRKVGHDGPPDSEYIAIYEAPGEGEEDFGVTRGLPYGRPLQGKTGYFMRIRHLAHVGLQELLPNPRSPRSPRLGRLHAHLMNVVMCRPPGNKIDSPEGKKAARCCANSARWFINERLRENPNRLLAANGGTALSMLRGATTPIDPYRGRPLYPETWYLEYEDENDIMKYVLRGAKPQEEWWPAFEVWLKSFIKLYKKSARHIATQVKKEADATWLASNPWLTEWTKLWKKQKAAMTRRLKKETTCST